MKVTFDAEFKRGDILYRRNDPDQYKGVVMGYRLVDGIVSYVISFPDSTSYYSPEELSDVEDIEYRQKYETNYD